MKDPAGARSTAEQDRGISAVILREQGRLRNFIRKRVPVEADVEDVLQDVFYELVLAYRLAKPLEQLSAWLFRTARNRIIDLFRTRKSAVSTDDLQDVLPSPQAGPADAYAQRLLGEQLEGALDELPAEQRAVFIAHELEGLSFREISDATGVSVNTLLSRKHYAVRYLRKRLRAIYDEFLDE